MTAAPAAASAAAPAAASAPSVTARRPRRPLRQAGLALAVVALIGFALFPVYWMLSSAVDPGANSRGSSLLPGGFTWDHFQYVLDRGGFGRYLANSALVGLGTVLLAGALSLFAAIAVARFRFRMRTKVLIMILIVQMVPLEALVIPLFLQMRNLQLLNTLLGLIIVYLAFSLPFAIWTLRGFVAAVPKEIEEAAYLDGCGWWRMFWSVLLPLVAPGLVATSIFAFIVAWNEFIFAFVFMQDQTKYTAAVGLRYFAGPYATDWGAIMAGSTLITLPVLIFFILVQRRLASGLAAGAVKG